MKDLFEHYQEQPTQLKVICDKYAEMDGFSYSTTEKFLKEVEAIGYTFDYGLCGEPFNLTKKQ